MAAYRRTAPPTAAAATWLWSHSPKASPLCTCCHSCASLCRAEADQACPRPAQLAAPPAAPADPAGAAQGREFAAAALFGGGALGCSGACPDASCQVQEEAVCTPGPTGVPSAGAALGGLSGSLCSVGRLGPLVGVLGCAGVPSAPPRISLSCASMRSLCAGPSRCAASRCSQTSACLYCLPSRASTCTACVRCHSLQTNPPVQHVDTLLSALRKKTQAPSNGRNATRLVAPLWHTSERPLQTAGRTAAALHPRALAAARRQRCPWPGRPPALRQPPAAYVHPAPGLPWVTFGKA